MAKAAAADKKTQPVYKVKSSFRDRNNFLKEYKEGDDVSHLDQSILDSLVERNLVTTGETEASSDGTGEDTGAETK